MTFDTNTRKHQPEACLLLFRAIDRSVRVWDGIHHQQGNSEGMKTKFSSPKMVVFADRFRAGATVPETVRSRRLGCLTTKVGRLPAQSECHGVLSERWNMQHERCPVNHDPARVCAGTCMQHDMCVCLCRYTDVCVYSNRRRCKHITHACTYTHSHLHAYVHPAYHNQRAAIPWAAAHSARRSPLSSDVC